MSTAQKMQSKNASNPQDTADFVIFTEENLNEKLHFLCSKSLPHICLTFKYICSRGLFRGPYQTSMMELFCKK